MKVNVADIKNGWWIVRFKIKWPENSEPSWHIDVLLAHQIIAPALKLYKNNITLWRFHRRAARDHEGHQFSFMFHAPPETADVINTLLKSNKLLNKLERADILTDVIYEDCKSIIRPNIEDTSDPHWSPKIRKSWPYFIMGVCDMWLSLISEISKDKSLTQKRTSLNKILDYYQEINEIIKKDWKEEGSHAFLHHLNAIFGYVPVLVHEIALRQF